MRGLTRDPGFVAQRRPHDREPRDAKHGGGAEEKGSGRIRIARRLAQLRPSHECVGDGRERPRVSVWPVEV